MVDDQSLLSKMYTGIMKVQQYLVNCKFSLPSIRLLKLCFHCLDSSTASKCKVSFKMIFVYLIVYLEIFMFQLVFLQSWQQLEAPGGLGIIFASEAHFKIPILCSGHFMKCEYLPLSQYILLQSQVTLDLVQEKEDIYVIAVHHSLEEFYKSFIDIQNC